MFILVLSFSSCGKNNSQKSSESASIISKANGEFKAYKTKSPVKIDGNSKDSIWTTLDWYSMNYIWMGETVDSDDYHGKFKLAWDSQYLYVLVEVIDDFLNPTVWTTWLPNLANVHRFLINNVIHQVTNP